MKTNKIMSIGLALFINVGIISGCSTTQMPNTSSNQNTNSSIAQSSNSIDTSLGANTNTNIISENTEPAPSMQDQLAITTEVKADLEDDETTTEDSEIVANEDSNFSTKAVDTKIKANTKVGLGLGLKPILAKVLGRNQREKILNDSENILKAKIKVNESKLKLLKDFKKFSVLKRKDVDVKNSDAVEVKNDDGTTSKIKTVKFEGQNDKIIRENKIIKTYATNSQLIKVEHYLTVDGPNFDRTYTKIVDYNNDGSKKAVVKSDSKWSNGRSRVVNRERNIDASGNGTGTGTIIITEKDGKTRAYDFSVIITAGNDSIITPVATALPIFSVTPIPTATPIVEVIASTTVTTLI